MAGNVGCLIPIWILAGSAGYTRRYLTPTPSPEIVISYLWSFPLMIDKVFLSLECAKIVGLGNLKKKFVEKVYFCQNTRVISCKSFEEWWKFWKMTYVDIFFLIFYLEIQFWLMLKGFDFSLISSLKSHSKMFWKYFLLSQRPDCSSWRFWPEWMPWQMLRWLFLTSVDLMQW